MPQPYSMDLRTRVVAAAQRQTHEQVAARFAVSASTVSKWCRRAREAGSPAPKPHRGGTPGKVAGARAAVLADLVAAQVVVLDNPSVHRAAAVRRLIEAAGCSSCRRTRRTSTPSSRRGASSRRSCAGSARAASGRCAPRSPGSSTRSPRRRRLLPPRRLRGTVSREQLQPPGPSTTWPLTVLPAPSGRPHERQTRRLARLQRAKEAVVGG